MMKKDISNLEISIITNIAMLKTYSPISEIFEKTENKLKRDIDRLPKELKNGYYQKLKQVYDHHNELIKKEIYNLKTNSNSDVAKTS